MIFPILLYTSYTLYSEQFFNQAISVFFFAVLGTLLNVFLTGVVLKYVYADIWNPSMNLSHCFVFGSLISVGDPLAIRDVFRGVEAAKENFSLLFGVALVGYGVAMELFEAANAVAVLGEDELITTFSYFYVAASTITDSVLGIIIGIICGLFSASITRCTSIESQYFEPLITLGCALFGYLLCLDLGFSYIFSTISCGLVQERYTFMNMSPRSSMCTKNIIFGLAFLSEDLMLILIGYLIVNIRSSTVWEFSLAVIITITIVRVFTTLGISLFLNSFKISTIPFKWQLLLLFGGQRGPMSFAMVLTYIGPFHLLFQDTTLLVILISEMLGGIISKYLVANMKMKLVVHRYNFLTSNCLDSLEQRIFQFFITDEDMLTNVYRRHCKEERELALQMLQKHSYVTADGPKMDKTDECGEAIEMGEMSHNDGDVLNND